MKKRIVIYGMNYAPEIAGVGRYTGEIGAYLASLGHEVSVVTTPPHYPGWRRQGGYGHGWSRDTRDGVEVLRCPLHMHRRVHGVWRLVAPLSFALSSAPVAFWRILTRRPDVVIAVEPTLFVGPLALVGAALVGARRVLHVQDLEVEAAFAVGHLGADGWAHRAAALFDRWVTRRFHRVVTISDRMAEKIRAKGVPADQVRVVRNWVDLDQIGAKDDGAAYRKELALGADDFVVLYAGNLGAKQGVRVLLAAAERLADQPGLRFVVAGDGPMRGDVEAAAARLPNLRALPFQPEERFGEFLRVADLHVLPQERDAADLLLPSKLGGMLASGRPILVTADPDTELWTFLGSSCRFTPPGDAVALAQAIAEMARTIPDRDTEAQRLQLARQLSKSELIEVFARTALFLQDARDQAADCREAA